MAVPQMDTSSPVPVPVPALYVGDLHVEVTDANLFDLFITVGVLTSVRVCRDSTTGRSLGYGYVNYSSPQDVSFKIECLDYFQNLSAFIDNARLHEIFGEFGAILSCKVAADNGRKNRGYGFVQFDKQESAESAIQNLNGATVEGEQIYVGNFVKRSERVVLVSEAKYTNLYMKNLDQDITEELIELKFSRVW